MRWFARAVLIVALAFVAVSILGQLRGALTVARNQVMTNAALESDWLRRMLLAAAGERATSYDELLDATAATLGPMTACATPGPCICPEPLLSDRCRNIPIANPAPGTPSDPSRSNPFAKSLLDLASWSRPLSNDSAIVSVQSAQADVGFIIIQPSTSVVRDRAASSVVRMYPLFAAALAAPLLLFIAMSAVAARARARLAVASRIAAERERDAAMAAQALTETALRGTSTTLAELGHEIISPAESLRHTAAHLHRLGEASPEWRGLLEHSFVGLMDGYIERIVRASERVRLALQMQKRHAERVRDRHRIGLNEFFRARLEAEQLSGALPYEFRAAPDEVYVIADQGDLEEVVGNLLSNARRFCNSLPISVAVTPVPPFVRITLRNEGPVVPRGSEERIFESGVSLSPGAAHESTGLGLFLVRAAVSAMQGRVYVENDPEPAANGVTFIIDLPIYDPASDAG